MANQITGSALGRMIRRRRKELGLTQEELEARSGVPQRTISDIERATNPHYLPEDPETLRRLGAALGLSMEEMLRAAGYLPAEDEEPTEAQVYTKAMEDIDRLELPERVKRMMREAVEYARELAEHERRKR